MRLFHRLWKSRIFLKCMKIPDEFRFIGDFIYGYLSFRSVLQESSVSVLDAVAFVNCCMISL